MADKVFVNGKAAVHKGSAGMTMALSPQLNPPSPPAGPVPLPLPNVARAKDLDKGAKTVLISGNPQGHKDSVIKRSMGDEPALPPPTFAGVVTHVKNGATQFQSHSPNVFVEGKPAVTHADLTTHDHR